MTKTIYCHDQNKRIIPEDECNFFINGFCTYRKDDCAIPCEYCGKHSDIIDNEEYICARCFITLDNGLILL